MQKWDGTGGQWPGRTHESLDSGSGSAAAVGGYFAVTGALMAPIWAIKLTSTAIASEFSLCFNRAQKAGVALAEALAARTQGVVRPRERDPKARGRGKGRAQPPWWEDSLNFTAVPNTPISMTLSNCF